MSKDLFWPAENETDPGDTLPLPGSASWGAGPAVAARPRTPWRAPALAAGLAALVFGGIGVGVGAEIAGGDGTPPASGSGLTVAPASARVAADPRSLAGVAAKVLPAVVSINVQVNGGGDTGSGVIVRQDGYILTNNHVIAAAVGGGANITVTFNDGTTAAATIVGADAEDDLAVIKVAKTGLPVAVLGSASTVKVGDPVLAIGSPLGLQGTVTSGIVSSVNRPVGTSDQSQNPFGGQSGPTTVIDAIQTDAAINPGNSGGPLVNTAGEVIGINSAIASTGSSFGGQAGNIGVGFAIPVDQAKVVAQELIATGKATHPLLGVSIGDATDSNGTPLARVQSVLAGGPAEKAGIKVGDIIVAVGDQKTAGAQAAIAAIRSHQPGQQVTVTVLRGSDRKTFTVTLVDASTAQG
ncbi:MAG: putative serine protease PepD [Frankiaceae bacterium]|nr:putative serine protease PepD [Frankiaceae bacterium]